MSERPRYEMGPGYVLKLDPKRAAQQAQLRAAERQGKRIAVQFEPPKKPWGKPR